MMKTIALAAVLVAAFAVPAMADVVIPAKDQSRFGELREKHGAHPHNMNYHSGKLGKGNSSCSKKAAGASTPEYAKWEKKKCEGKVKAWKAKKGKPFHKTI